MSTPSAWGLLVRWLFWAILKDSLPFLYLKKKWKKWIQGLHRKFLEFHFSLKSPKIFVQVLEKSFECSGLERVFLMLFGCPRQNINHSSENLKGIYIKCSMFYAIINYQFTTSELKKVEKLVNQTVQALKPYQNRLGMCIFVQSVKSYS